MPSRSYSEEICHNNENEKIGLGRLFFNFVLISSQFHWILCLAFWRSYFNELFNAGLLCEFIQTFFKSYSIHKYLFLREYALKGRCLSQISSIVIVFFKSYLPKFVYTTHSHCSINFNKKETASRRLSLKNISARSKYTIQSVVLVANKPFTIIGIEVWTRVWEV